MKVFWLIPLVTFYNSESIIGQTPDSALNANIRVWNKYAGQRKPDLFVHFDKSLYTPSENMLFTAYLLDKGSDTAAQHTLYIVLIDLTGRKVVASDRFLMSEGISSGALFIPDTLESGEYLVTAYTNAMGERYAEPFFRQEIRIRSRDKPAFTLSASLSPDSLAKGDSIRLTCKIGTDYGGLASGGAFQYSIFGDGQLLQSGKRVIDAFGETHITLPPADTLLKSILLHTTIKRKDNTAHLRTPLILRPEQIEVTYYPESGSLIDGHTVRIGIEIRKAGGMGISTSGTLVEVEDGRVIAHFQTDSYGLGFFEGTFHTGKKYESRLTNLPPGTYTCGTFPDILPTGFSLHIEKAIVRDSLTLTIQGPASGSRGILMIYSDQALLYTAQIGLNGEMGNLVLPVKDWPGGIAEAALFTEDGARVAGRTIYLPAPRVLVSIQTDSSVYHPRSKVNMRVKVTDEEGHGIKGLFSVAAALSSRAGLAGIQDIGLHLNLEHNLVPDQAGIPPPDYFDNDSAIDKVLLTRRWKQHSWQAAREDTVATAKAPVEADDYGHVLLSDGRKLRKPVALFLLGPSMYNFETDSSGHFQIPYQALIAPIGSNAILSVIDKRNQADYTIVIKNRYDPANQQLAASWYSPQFLTKDTIIREEEEDNGVFNSVKTLKAAVVRSSGNNDDYDSQTSGSCRDYVCMNNVLNCPNHPYGTKPVVGRSYTYVDRSRGPFAQGSTIVYKECMSCKGCDSSSFIGLVHGIHLTKEFYKTDSANFSPTEPAIYSTLYWGPLIVTDKNGEAAFSFFTDDLKGRFYAMVQGLSPAGVFSGKKLFTVSGQ